ncbi:sugar ABC transporter ATP-binding protein [Thermoanaerobacterium thermosulfurigenes]|uniref:sugar ABC transporter ATP-binding protein n=1 Tax=Thermoanaerobacterium thermosulfurigenes TaxID=33950 RepID=UPI003EF4E21A
MSTYLLEMRNICKSFPGVQALKDVNFDLNPGEVHALLGENGAGKSTLIKILGGIYKMDEGDIYINGNKVIINSVHDSKKYGISIIHQELMLIPYMTVAENIFLFREFVDKWGLVNKKLMNENAQAILKEFNFDIDPKTIVCNLTIGQQQMIEIIKAVTSNSKIIVMDEPTSSLSEEEVSTLFNVIKQLKQNGVGIIYISHRMSELEEIADRVTVLRDGQYVGTKLMDETNNDELISMMVGRKIENYYTRTFDKQGEVIFEVRNLTRKGVIDNVSFDLRKGEILGFAGLIGAGRSETARCIFGIDKYDSGVFLINNKEIKIKNTVDAIKNGIALVPENRKEEGLFLLQDCKFNISFQIIDKFIKLFFIDRKYELQIAEKYIRELTIRTPSVKQKVGYLSGGNQQKIVIAKWLSINPKIIILDEPTRGIDVGAKAEIYRIIDDLRKQGVSIIMISSELPEIINMSDRVVVMSHGKITKILNKEELSQENIMHYALGGI